MLNFLESDLFYTYKTEIVKYNLREIKIIGNKSCNDFSQNH